ncbi:MAG TPA: glutamate synthase-related protein [Thermodesulfobacteriota bacterium]|nr:glutamate synthase-related protein [Thermodesulfobacteriota bacterium]
MSYPPEIKRAPSRYRNPIAKFRMFRSRRCNHCGLCQELCPRGVHARMGKKMIPPKDESCIGPSCRGNDYYCVQRCPQGALRLLPNASLEALTDYRWPADLLVANWQQAENGGMPYSDVEYRVGKTGGGFDRLRMRYPKSDAALRPKEEEISTSLVLNRRGDGRPEVRIAVPFYGGGMSFGSVSNHAMIARARAAKAWDTFTCTGEGGYPDSLRPYDDHMITQVATGLFGVREETIQRVRIVEFKYAQGAKPGLGGHLLGDKVTPAVARMREAVVGNALFSPFPFHSVYSVEDHKKHVDWIKQVNPRALISVKVSTPTDVDMVAVGSYYAGAHIIHLDGSYGGTGAAPDIAKKNIAMPIEYAIPKVHRFLLEEGIRDHVTLIASGEIRNAFDMTKAIALGADGVVVGTADLVALECIRCHNCESGRGCPRGIATTDPEFTNMIDTDWGAQRIINLYGSWRKQLTAILSLLGMKSVAELVGRTDCLAHLDYQPAVDDDVRAHIGGTNGKNNGKDAL